MSDIDLMAAYEPEAQNTPPVNPENAGDLTEDELIKQLMEADPMVGNLTQQVFQQAQVIVALSNDIKLLESKLNIIDVFFGEMVKENPEIMERVKQKTIQTAKEIVQNDNSKG